MPARTWPQSVATAPLRESCASGSGKRGRGELPRVPEGEQAALPAADVLLVAHEEVDQQVDARRPVRAQRRLGEVTGLCRLRDAEHPVGRIGLVAVLGEPDALRPERARDEREQTLEVGHRDVLAEAAATGGRRLTAADRIRMVRVRVEPRVREVHAADPVDRRDAARATARRGHAAADEVRAVRPLERVVGRVEQQPHVGARARRAELPVLVRLVPDHPAPHVRVALGRRVGEVRERARARRRPVRGASAVRPARRADERHDRRDAARAKPAEQDVAGGPAVRRIEVRRRLRRTLRRDLVPAQVDPDDVDAERVDLVEPLVERPRSPEQPRVVLDPVLNVGGRIRACLEHEERTERDDRREHDSKHAANVATPCFQVVSVSSGLR